MSQMTPDEKIKEFYRIGEANGKSKHEIDNLIQQTMMLQTS